MTKLHSFLIPQGKAKTIEFPSITAFFPGFQWLWFSCSKGASLSDISAKVWHPFISFPLAVISSTLRPILWPCQMHTNMSIFPTLKYIANLEKVPLSGAPNDNFRENICSEDDLRSRIFGTFVVKFLACLPLLGFSNI